LKNYIENYEKTLDLRLAACYNDFSYEPLGKGGLGHKHSTFGGEYN